MTSSQIMTQTLDGIRQSGLPVVIFGAATVGEVLFRVFEKHGVPVACFCDNNSGLSGQRKCGVEIVHTSRLRERYPDAQIVISAADIQDVVGQLRGLGYSKLHPGGLFLRTLDLADITIAAPYEFVDFAVTTCLMCHEAYADPDKLFFRSVDVVITERCSLRCRQCSNLMQYYEKPQDVATDEIFRSIDALCSGVDGINEFRVIGGEPFMHKSIDVIIDRLIKEPKVRKVIVYTNGTILPKPQFIPCLQDSKVLVLLTDYGKLSRHTDAVRRLFDDNRIAYFSRPADGWTDCSTIGKHGRSSADQKIVYRDCCAKNLFTLLGGKLFRCPFSANADRLSAVPDFPADYVDLFQPSAGQDMKGRLRKFVFSTASLGTCDYCSGRSLSDAQIEPAIQTKAPLPYQRAR